MLLIFASQVTIDFAPGKEFADLNVAAECRRLSTLDKVNFKSKEVFAQTQFYIDQPAICNLQVLEEFPKTQINIDLKDQEESLVARVEEVVKAHGAENRLAKFPKNSTQLDFYLFC